MERAVCPLSACERSASPLTSLLAAQSKDPSQQQTQAVLKFIPFMIGWFSLNVPSGLTLYWFTNNVLSTAQQLYMKRTIKVGGGDAAAAATSGAGGVTIDTTATAVRPKEERVKKVGGVAG